MWNKKRTQKGSRESISAMAKALKEANLKHKKMVEEDKIKPTQEVKPDDTSQEQLKNDHIHPDNGNGKLFNPEDKNRPRPTYKFDEDQHQGPIKTDNIDPYLNEETYRKPLFSKIPIKNISIGGLLLGFVWMNYNQYLKIDELKKQITNPVEFSQQVKNITKKLNDLEKSNKDKTKQFEMQISSNQKKINGLEGQLIAGNHFLNRQQVLGLNENFTDELSYQILINNEFQSLKYDPKTNKISLFEGSLDIKPGLTAIIQNFQSSGASPTNSQIKSLFQLIGDAYLTANIDQETAQEFTKKLDTLFKDDDNAYGIFHSLKKDINYLLNK